MTWLQGADRSQDFSKKYPGSAIKADKCVIHTTEGASWPGYDGGANAPHLTVLVDKATGAMRWRQHFPLNRSSRALKNLPGGVETNTDDTIQVELIGTCDPRAVAGWAKNSVLWPAAEEKHLSGVRAVLRAIVAAVPTIPWQDAARRGWKAYPSSYANGAGQRLTFDEWRNARGFLGHQHVPENTHGDPGNLPIAALLGGSAETPEIEEIDMTTVHWVDRGAIFTLGPQFIKHEIDWYSAEVVRNELGRGPAGTKSGFIEVRDPEFGALVTSLGIPWYAVQSVLDGNAFLIDGRLASEVPGQEGHGKFWSRESEIMQSLLKINGVDPAQVASVLKTAADKAFADLSDNMAEKITGDFTGTITFDKATS